MKETAINNELRALRSQLADLAIAALRDRANASRYEAHMRIVQERIDTLLAM